MAQADGSIVIKTEMDNKQAQKELSALEKKINDTEKSVADTQKKRDEARQKEIFSAAELDSEKAKLQEIKDRLQEIKTLSKDKTVGPDARAEYAETIPGVKEELVDQQARVRSLQTEYNKVASSVERYDAKIVQAKTDLSGMKERAGELVQEISTGAGASAAMGKAINKAENYMKKFTSRVKKLGSRVLVFSVITMALRSLRTFVGKVIKTNDEASAAISKFKGALLTLAQPLVEVIVPAFTIFVNVLARAASFLSKVISTLFGKTAKESAQAAKNLYEEAKALDETGNSAKDAGKSLADFDEINKLSANESSKNIDPDFSGSEDDGFISKLLGGAADKVASALLLAGVAFIAIGAARGSIPMVITGLALIGAGIFTAESSGVLQSWVDVLGLNNVKEFLALAIMLGGIAMVAIGACLTNILLIIAGLALIGVSVLYSEKSGLMQSWEDALGLSRAATYITAALLIGGFALIAIGAILQNALMVISGLALLAVSVYVGVESGAFRSWVDALGIDQAAGKVTSALLIGGFALIVIGAGMLNLAMVIAGIGLIAAGIYIGKETGGIQSWIDALKLDSVFRYVSTALCLGGIALIAIGAMRGSLAIVIAGGLLLGAGVIADVAGEETIKNWWETLKLTNVFQWVTVALLLVGIAMVAIGAALGRISLVLAGGLIIGLGALAGAQDGRLEDWVKTLGLEKVVGWVTAALMLLGMALLVFGIMTYNIIMILAGGSLLIAGFAIGAESGTFGSWVDALGLNEVAGWVSTALLLAGIALVAIGATMLNPIMIMTGLALLGSGAALKTMKGSSALSTNRGKGFTGNVRRSAISPSANYHIPALASGAVIPPNREFMAVLGDQKRGTNIEAPVSEIEAAVSRGISAAKATGGRESLTIIIKPAAGFARNLKYELDEESSLQGVNLVRRV